MKDSTIRTICYGFILHLFVVIFVLMLAEPEKKDKKPTRYGFDNSKPAPWMDPDKEHKPGPTRGPIKIQHNATTNQLPGGNADDR